MFVSPDHSGKACVNKMEEMNELLALLTVLALVL